MIIHFQSGIPPIDPDLLAPTESGAQLLRLPATDFERRCMKTPGVSTQQAKAFRLKLWQMHVNSQHAGNKSNTKQPNSNGATETDTMFARLGLTNGSSSRDSHSAPSKVLFKNRIRPGMVVSWNLPDAKDSKIDIPGALKLAAVLCPVDAVQPAFEQAVDLTGNSTEEDGDTRYLCTLITPGQTPDAYELNLWRPIIIGVSQMENEVILEYDAGTRYYYISV